MSFLGNLRTFLVADDRIEGSNDADTVLYHLVAALLVDGDAEDTLRSQSLDSVLHPCQALEEALGDDRLHYVQLQLTSLCCEAYSSIVTDYLEANLVGYLRDNRVHLTWHDRRTWCLGREIDFVQTAARTRSHQTEVVTDLR